MIFTSPLSSCPECGRRLVVYKTATRKVRTINGEFTAVHRIMTCRFHRRQFRSETLNSIVSPCCTYSNDVMIDAAIKRFIDGMSCSDISRSIGISESHAGNLSNMALDIISTMHYESAEKLRESMKSWILHIDGTPDSEFSMIVVVRDSLSGFNLWSRKCFSES